MGESRIPSRFIEGLHDKDNIRKEIDAYVTALFPPTTTAEGSEPAALKSEL